jgi:hypothetical protein
MTTPWLSQEEVDDLCEPLKQHAAQVRFIRRLGIAVRMKPNGAPLVMRTQLEETMNPAGKRLKPAKTEPNREALVLAFGRGKKIVA